MGPVRSLAATSLAALVALATPAVAETELPVPCSPEPTDMAIAYGSLVTCEIAPIGDLDVFRFAGKEGEAVLLRAEATDAGDACVELRAPSGEILQSNCFSGIVTHKLPSTGTYSIQVRNSLNGTMSYTLLLERIWPPSPTAMSICPGCTLTNLMIDPGWDYDLYGFEGQAGDAITVQVGGLSGGSPCVDVVSPSDTPPSFGLNCALGYKSLTLEEAGTHTIVVWEYLSDETLDYTVNLQCFGDCPERAALLTCDIQLDQDSYVDGQTVMSTLRLANHFAVDVKTEVKFWLGIPGYAPFTIVNLGSDGSLALPAGFDQTYGPATFFEVSSSLPRGIYDYSCRMLDPTTGELLTVDVNPFQLQ
jgi:hypothetical protein